MYEKKPLYRKVNSKARGAWHGSGGQFKWDRNTKRIKENESVRGSMHRKHQHGLDYTPLYRFLLSKVGCDWNEVHSEAVSRLDTQEPIFHLVARNEAEMRDRVGVDESTYFSGLFIDDKNRLAVVNPDLRIEDMKPYCPCCTHTFNGKPFVKKFAS